MSWLISTSLLVTFTLSQFHSSFYRHCGGEKKKQVTRNYYSYNYAIMENV